MQITLGISPCPNDTFIFDALVNQKIDTEGIEFITQLEDVETLNQCAIESRLDVTKLSFPAYFASVDNYSLLQSGAALGNGVGPLLIANKVVSVAETIADKTIAIPGLHTTANLLLQFALPQARQKQPMLFSQIEHAVKVGAVDMGVIIHENRFTYEAKGLKKVLDLGEYWEQKNSLPIPLGCIVVRKELGVGFEKIMNHLIKSSLEYAYSAYPHLPDFVVKNAVEMNLEIMNKHIDLYVNEYSFSLGTVGLQAIGVLHDVWRELG